VAADPLDFLLNEKKLADVKGNGMDALRLAEEYIDVRMDDDSEEIAGVGSRLTSVKGTLMDESAARRAIAEGMPSPKLSSPSGSTERAITTEDPIVLGEDEAKLLGLKDGGRMKKILDSDRSKRGKEIDKVLGVKLWDDTRSCSDSLAEPVRQEFPSVTMGEHPVLCLLGNAWHHWSKCASDTCVTVVLTNNYNR
jgi:hypothetical protein